MSSPWATIALTYDGTDILDVDGIHLEITYGLAETGDTRGVDVTVPGADGQATRPRRFHQRKILLDGFVRGDGADQADRQADYRSKIGVLRDLFSEIDPPKDLVAVTEDGMVWTIAARTNVDGRIIDEKVKSEWADVSIELLAIQDWDSEPAGS